jgi:nucleoside-diphosphate-sugar epimerase
MLIEGIWRTLRLSSTPPLTRHAIDLMCCDCSLNINKIEEDLGYRPIVSVVEGLRQLNERGAA